MMVQIVKKYTTHRYEVQTVKKYTTHRYEVQIVKKYTTHRYDGTDSEEVYNSPL